MTEIELLLNQVNNQDASDDDLCEIAHKLLILKDGRAITPLLDRLIHGMDPWWVRRELLTALGGLSQFDASHRAEVADYLRAVLNSKNESDRVREVAALSLGLLQASQASSDLLSVLRYAIKSKNPGLIYSCVESLSMLKDIRSIKVLIKILDSDLPLVKVFAAKALGRFGSAAKDCLPGLRKLAANGSPAEKKFALESILKIEEEIDN